MSRFARATTLSAGLLSLAAVDAAAAPDFNLPCTTFQGRNVTLINNTGMEIPPGSTFIMHYYVNGKFDRREVFTSKTAFLVNASEVLGYSGGALSACAAVVKFPSRYEPKVNPNTRER